MAAEPQGGQETIQLQGVLKGHKGWVTCIGTSAEDPNKVLSGSRDKTIIVWKLNEGQPITNEEDGDTQLGQMQRRLVGHHHFVQDLDISSDGHFALSASWDNTLRLWDLNSGQTENQFRGHTKDVMSVAFSSDNRQVVSGSRDKTIKLWNVIGECKYTMNRGNENAKPAQTSHDDWVTCCRFSPSPEEPVIVSAGCDGLVKVWNLQKCELKFCLVGHKQQINTVTVSPDGSLCASGGKDKQAMLWDLNEGGHLSTLDAGKEINALCFSPNRYWLCAACGSSIKIWDLESKQEVGVLDYASSNGDEDHEAQHGGRRSKKVPVLCTSLAWSHDGSTLFAGYTDHLIRVYRLSRSDF